LGRDERLVLFATAAHKTARGNEWVVPVHGRVFRPPDGRAAKAALAIALKTGFGVSPDALSRIVFDERCALMLGDNCEHRRIAVTVAGMDFQLAPTDRYGQFRGTILIPQDVVEAHSSPRGLEVTARLAARDHRRFAVNVLMIGPEGLSIISDIDDTVKITHVSSRRRMMALTFLEPFEAVTGMAERYRSWSAQGASLHFISSSPWPLYEPLERFLGGAGFPPATITLKNVALKDRSIRNLFAKATKTKPPAIDAILADFPSRQFVLIGDSAENDAEIYADAARRHGAQIKRILIRDCRGRGAGLQRAREALSDIDPGSWRIFEQPHELPETLF
jgi:phosphatidate phosphatase APP1